MPETIRIVVLGGGYGGVEAAKVLERQLGGRRDVQITLIDRNSSHTLMTELHEVAGGRVEPESVQISFRRFSGRARSSWSNGRHPHGGFPAPGKPSRTRRVIPTTTSSSEPAVSPKYYGLPGIKEHAFTLWSMDDALRLRRHLEDMYRKASAERDPEKRRKMLTFVVAGAGFHRRGAGGRADGPAAPALPAFPYR